MHKNTEMENDLILMKLSSLVALEVVKKITSSAASDETIRQNDDTFVSMNTPRDHGPSNFIWKGTGNSTTACKNVP